MVTPLRLFLVPLLAVFLFTPAALAAPTCLDRDANTVRCGTPGAMPVGWVPTPEQLSHRRVAPGPTTGEIAQLLCAFGLFLAMIALMPRFDGTREGDWDRQESDGDARNRRL